MKFKTWTLEQCYQLVKGRPEAWLLQHLIFWQPKATAMRDGKLWVVRTQEEFREKFKVPYAERTLKRGIMNLEAAGWIERTHGPHPFRNGVIRVTWLRLSDELQEKLGWTGDTDASDEPISGNPFGKK